MLFHRSCNKALFKKIGETDNLSLYIWQSDSIVCIRALNNVL